MFKNSKARFVGKAMVSVLLLSFAIVASAQHSVEFSDETVAVGGSVEVTFTFSNPGGDSAVEARARISDMGVFSNVDPSGLCSNADADFVQCGINDTNRIVILFTNFDASAAVPDFTGTIVFDVDPGIDPTTLPQTIDIEWGDEGLTFTPSETTDGSIEITETPPGPESDLSIAPDPMTFGTVDLGNMPQTQDFTVTIGGDSGADDVTISDVALTGDAEFSIAADNCNGNTFSVPSSCTITIEFDAASDGSYSASIEVTSDADNTPVVTADITGDADSVANIDTTLGGVVNLGFGAPGSTVSTSGSFTNAGSADGDVSCVLTDPDGVFSTTPSPLEGLVPAGGSLDFTVSCDLPAEADEGDTFGATLSCTGDNDFTSDHELTCGVSTFEPLPVPTMQPWALALFGLMMLLIGGISIRFFRAS